MNPYRLDGQDLKGLAVGCGCLFAVAAALLIALKIAVTLTAG
jgi:hypothetical protein